jgi:hypothetical protein
MGIIQTGACQCHRVAQFPSVKPHRRCPRQCGHTYFSGGGHPQRSPGRLVGRGGRCADGGRFFSTSQRHVSDFYGQPQPNPRQTATKHEQHAQHEQHETIVGQIKVHHGNIFLFHHVCLERVCAETELHRAFLVACAGQLSSGRGSSVTPVPRVSSVPRVSRISRISWVSQFPATNRGANLCQH